MEWGNNLSLERVRGTLPTLDSKSGYSPAGLPFAGKQTLERKKKKKLSPSLHTSNTSVNYGFN